MLSNISAGSFLALTFAASVGVLASYFYITTSPKKKKSKVQGIVNLGNTCFANALLQCFAGSTCFASWFQNSKRKTKSNLLSELSSIIDTINQATGKDDCEISARNIIDALERRNWKIDYHVQHDLYELLNVFITTWDEELAENNCSKWKISSFSDVSDISKADGKDGKGLELLQLLANSISNKADQKPPCSGLQATQFVCTSCGHKHVRHDRFCTLSLSLPKTSFRQYITIEDCLRKYFAAEKLYNVTCDKCKEKSTDPAIGKSNFYKYTGFSKLPDCLILHLDRVNWMPNGMAYKQDDFVQFNEYLDVSNYLFYSNKKQDCTFRPVGIVGGKMQQSSQFMERGDFAVSQIGNLHAMSRSMGGGLQQHPIVLNCNQTGDFMLDKPTNSDKTKYKLKAVAAHLGRSHDQGHFVAYRRGAAAGDDRRWYLTSDDDVRQVDFDSDVKHCQAYMLFYERVSSSTSRN